MVRKLGLKQAMTAAVALVGACVAAMPANAATSVWKFTGTCLDCTTPGAKSPATGTLTLQDYTAGEALTTANYVSFTYSSLLYPTLDFGAATGFSGSLVNGASDVTLFSLDGLNLNAFATASNGSFSLVRTFLGDIGENGTWQEVVPSGAVPEAATWGMMLVGFGAMGATLRRRRSVTLQNA
ncbi:PEPxxWA-CTERM sorting domain-containing protein [uncultured Sphingomonas sp.]|uniref:PEPxxWA-CTERM sorting domain-containing protein n=1 Tax=uncultured Sphingomonas sp. TaxID=158754 RepID=UPI0025FE96CE|nr:PEPxxWA-CTERM sorting domain-containing protein [uncultured Sphingomonas sp.]